MSETVSVFLGSTKPAYESIVRPFRTVFEQVAAEHRGGRWRTAFKLLAWPDSFRNGEQFLQGILRSAKECDFAFLFFCNDERGVQDSGRVTLDNVILEAGAFAQALGIERVSIVVEEGVGLPSDMWGLHQTVRLGGRDQSSFDVHLRESLCKLLDQWGPLADRIIASRRPSTSALVNTFLSTIEDLRDSARLASADEGTLSDPLRIRPILCERAYTSTLKQVDHRFWTTTFVDSAFWTQDSEDVLESNLDLLGRLPEEKRDVRRIFLLREDEDVFFPSLGHRISWLRSARRADEITKLKSKAQRVSDRINLLTSRKCNVRVLDSRYRQIWDRKCGKTFDVIPDAGEAELAIFDERRVDFYRAQGATIYDAVCINRAYSGFFNCLTTAIGYFESLWQEAQEPLAFIERWLQAIDRYIERIEYTSNFIAKYEYGLSAEEEDKKRNEMEAALRAVRDHFGGGVVRRYLDIGTCTARYPLCLIEEGLLTEAGRAVAIDNDDDCIDFAVRKLREAGYAWVDVRNKDFLVSSTRDSFDLVTCMLGTLSHLTRQGKDMQRSLDQVCAKLFGSTAPGGLLLIGNWSEHACRTKDFLSIYKRQDVDRLVEGTPDSAALEDALRSVGFEVEVERVKDGSINLFHGRRPLVGRSYDPQGEDALGPTRDAR